MVMLERRKEHRKLEKWEFDRRKPLESEIRRGGKLDNGDYQRFLPDFFYKLIDKNYQKFLSEKKKDVTE